MLRLNPCVVGAREQRWSMNSSGFIHHSTSWCLAVRVDLGINYGVTVQPCTRPFSTFEVTDHKQLRSIDATTARQCLAGRSLAPVDAGESIELWVKPLATNNSTVAVLVTNLGADATIPISPAECGGLPTRGRGACASGFTVRDVWNRKDLRGLVEVDGTFNVSVRSTDSAFLIFKCRSSVV